MNTFAIARYRAGLGLVDAAERAGISARTISRLEAGLGRPTAPVVKSLADVYKTSVDELLGIEKKAA